MSWSGPQIGHRGDFSTRTSALPESALYNAAQKVGT
ncbi:MAG: hypothetical protein ACJASY_003469 [Halioglobus sp.]|jgi:hypothetical protein